MQAAIGREVAQFLDIAREKIRREQTLDLAWFETALRAAVQKDTATVVEHFLNHELPDLLPPEALRPGEAFHSWRERTVMTLAGPIQLRRAYYLSPQGGRCPLDERLGLCEKYTPAVAQLMCWAGAMDPSFDQGSQMLYRFAGLQIPSRQIPRVMQRYAAQATAWMAHRPTAPRSRPVEILNLQADMTAIPMRPEELHDVIGQQPDGSAKTRQIKLGCVFTQSTDAHGHPQRDPFSTTYVSTFGDATELGTLLYQEALKRGYASARTTVFLGDGAEWIWKMVADRFPDAVQIVDFYHACEHLHALCQTLEPDPQRAEALSRLWRRRLQRNGLPGILRQAEQRARQADPATRQSITAQLRYFLLNAQRMTYGTFHRQGFFIGSGTIEGGCRHIIAQRTKLSGMRWLRKGAANVLAFRSLIKSNLFDEFCKNWPPAA